MRSYVAFLVSAVLLPVVVGAVIVFHDGWEAAAAGLAIVVGMALLASLIALLASGDRLASPGRHPRPV
jgi:RsiW-degrading membrane proteinase PrsW (M82 family)